MKHVQDHAGFAALTGQHGLHHTDHTDHTDQKPICIEISRSSSGNRSYRSSVRCMDASHDRFSAEV